MDTILDFVFDFSRTPLEGISVPKRANGLTTRLATPEDLSEVLAVSEKAFANHFGRYNSDPKMPHGAATEVYREWVRSSFRGWADWILVAEIEGRIAGFGVWRSSSCTTTSQGSTRIFLGEAFIRRLLPTECE
jgi:hypothetical protein